MITKSISRFARNTVDCLEYVRQLKDLGIGVIFEKENINTLTMTSEFMIALYGSFAQAESESISKNVSWGKEKAYREGKVAFQYKHLLGYKKGDDGKPEIVPDEAETVRMIFKMYLDGYTLLNIAQSLMKQDRLTTLGKNVWTKGEVQRILKNEKYVGDALLQKTFTVDCITHKVMKNNGERPMYLVTDHHDPIVDRDTFNWVQQELARRWLHPEDAIKQRERLKAERIAAREQRVEPVREVEQQTDILPDEVLEPTENEREPIFEDEDLEQEEAFEMSM